MKKQSDNVIMFPLKGNPPQHVTAEQITLDMKMVKFNHINEALETIIPILFNNITIAGFDILPEEEENDENIKDNALIVESIRSILCKYYGLNHPLQEVAEEFFVSKGDGVLTITKHLDLDLSHYDKE
jgi:hypothetical protein